MCKKIKIAISPCPNDTFMFDGLINGKVDLMGYDFEITFADIDQLNRAVIEDSGVDISKISYATYRYIQDRYTLSPHGSAIGYGNAPLVVSSKRLAIEELQNHTIAIPGEKTTAALLLKRCIGKQLKTKEYLFSDIPHVVASGEVSCGVLIHEERFTYQEKGLKLVADLGELWDKIYGLPIPLGAIVVKNTLNKQVINDFNSILKSSITYALANPLSSREFIKKHAQNLNDHVIDSHIEMFVNNFSLEINEEGQKAIELIIK